MIEKILKFIDTNNLSDKTIVIGFSGGFDSMCLLDIMKNIAPKRNIKLIAGHYNHNWRGEIAKQEQEHCRDFCEEHKIIFYTETAPDSVKKTETQARELRYDFFERTKLKFNADAIFTAHNFDDNAETILYRIIKGTGIVGLKGITPIRSYFYRPLINIKRSEIEQYCVNNNLKPNNDNSNSDTNYKRNLIRHEIIPILEKINPEVKNALVSLGTIAASETNIVNEYIDIVEKDLLFKGKINTTIFKNLSNDVKQKIIYNLIYNSAIDYDRALIENILKFIDDTLAQNKPSKFSLTNNYWLYVDTNIIEIITNSEKETNSIVIDRNGDYNLNNAVFTINEYTNDYIEQTNESVALVDLSNISNLTLRTRNDGDIIKPLGFSGTMKLKKYFMSKKIPQHVRDKIILLCNGNEVLWVAGIGLSDKIKTTDKPTHKLEIKYQEEDLLWN